MSCSFENSEALSESPSPGKMPKCNVRSMLQLVRFFVAEILGLGIICFVVVFYDFRIGLVPPPLVVGMTFTFVVWLVGPISGAQVNPVVSLMLLATRRLSPVHTLVCILGQLVGGTIGAFLARSLLPEAMARVENLGMTLPTQAISSGQALALEVIGTGMLVLAVLAMADEIRPANWDQGHVVLFAFEFGVTLALLASLLGPYTGGSMNPTRSLATAILNNNYDYIWIYMVGPLLGMLLATLLFEFLLTNGLSAGRLRAWFTLADFDRNHDYGATV